MLSRSKRKSAARLRGDSPSTIHFEYHFYLLSVAYLVSHFGYAEILMILDLGVTAWDLASSILTTCTYQTDKSKGYWIGYLVVYVINPAIYSLTAMMVTQNGFSIADIAIGSRMVNCMGDKS